MLGHHTIGRNLVGINAHQPQKVSWYVPDIDFDHRFHLKDDLADITFETDSEDSKVTSIKCKDIRVFHDLIEPVEIDQFHKDIMIYLNEYCSRSDALNKLSIFDPEGSGLRYSLKNLGVSVVVSPNNFNVFCLTQVKCTEESDFTDIPCIPQVDIKFVIPLYCPARSEEIIQLSSKSQRFTSSEKITPAHAAVASMIKLSDTPLTYFHNSAILTFSGDLETEIVSIKCQGDINKSSLPHQDSTINLLNISNNFPKCQKQTTIPTLTSSEIRESIKRTGNFRTKICSAKIMDKFFVLEISGKVFKKDHLIAHIDVNYNDSTKYQIISGDPVVVDGIHGSNVCEKILDTLAPQLNCILVGCFYDSDLFNWAQKLDSQQFLVFPFKIEMKLAPDGDHIEWIKCPTHTEDQQIQIDQKSYALIKGSDIAETLKFHVFINCPEIRNDKQLDSIDKIKNMGGSILHRVFQNSIPMKLAKDQTDVVEELPDASQVHIDSVEVQKPLVDIHEHKLVEQKPALISFDGSNFLVTGTGGVRVTLKEDGSHMESLQCDLSEATKPLSDQLETSDMFTDPHKILREYCPNNKYNKLHSDSVSLRSFLKDPVDSTEDHVCQYRDGRFELEEFLVSGTISVKFEYKEIQFVVILNEVEADCEKFLDLVEIALNEALYHLVDPKLFDWGIIVQEGIDGGIKFFTQFGLRAFLISDETENGKISYAIESIICNYDDKLIDPCDECSSGSSLSERLKTIFLKSCIGVSYTTLSMVIDRINQPIQADEQILESSGSDKSLKCHSQRTGMFEFTLGKHLTVSWEEPYETIYVYQLNPSMTRFEHAFDSCKLLVNQLINIFPLPISSDSLADAKYFSFIQKSNCLKLEFESKCNVGHLTDFFVYMSDHLITGISCPHAPDKKIDLDMTDDDFMSATTLSMKFKSECSLVTLSRVVRSLSTYTSSPIIIKGAFKDNNLQELVCNTSFGTFEFSFKTYIANEYTFSVKLQKGDIFEYIGVIETEKTCENLVPIIVDSIPDLPELVKIEYFSVLKEVPKKVRKISKGSEESKGQEDSDSVDSATYEIVGLPHAQFFVTRSIEASGDSIYISDLYCPSEKPSRSNIKALKTEEMATKISDVPEKLRNLFLFKCNVIENNFEHYKPAIDGAKCKISPSPDFSSIQCDEAKYIRVDPAYAKTLLQ
jgi:hypothetical protein